MRPLEDVRIVAVEQYGAGPWGSLHLAELGAEVIKIEDPAVRGDVGRYVPPYAAGEDSLFFEAFNRDKRSLSLDLGTPEGRAVFEDLVQVRTLIVSAEHPCFGTVGQLGSRQGERFAVLVADESDVAPGSARMRCGSTCSHTKPRVHRPLPIPHTVPACKRCAVYMQNVLPEGISSGSRRRVGVKR